jgi:hypothetical protein
MSFRVELAAGRRRQPRCSATRGSGVACVEGAVKGGRSPAKRTLEGVRNANTLKGLGLVAAFRGQRPSPSGGKDFTALGGGARGGGARRARQGHSPHRGRFHTKRPKPREMRSQHPRRESCQSGGVPSISLAPPDSFGQRGSWCRNPNRYRRGRGRWRYCHRVGRQSPTAQDQAFRHRCSREGSTLRATIKAIHVGARLREAGRRSVEQARSLPPHNRQGDGATLRLPDLPDDAGRWPCADNDRPRLVVREIRERSICRGCGAVCVR